MENRRRKKEYVGDLEITQVAHFKKQMSSLEERLCRVEQQKQALETELMKSASVSCVVLGSRDSYS